MATLIFACCSSRHPVKHELILHELVQLIQKKIFSCPRVIQVSSRHIKPLQNHDIILNIL
ncbi:MAG: hypothetical protein ACTSWN_15900 [Promethearchaeota archaeon]